MGFRVLDEESFSSITDTPTPLSVVIDDLHFGTGNGQGASRSWYSQNLTYSIDDLGRNFTPAHGENGGRVTMSSHQHDQAVLAFELWDDLIVKGMSETNDAPRADITLNHTTHTEKGLTYATPDMIPNGTDDNIMLGSQVWINPADVELDEESDYNVGRGGFETYLHEIGHSLGLSHPGPYTALDPSIPVTPAFTEDNTQYTVMSYIDAPLADHSVPGWLGIPQYVWAQTPMLYDVVAIQAAYGADYDTRSGDTVYGFHSTAGRSVFDFNQNKLPVLTIWDGGGVDTIDASGYSDNQTIYLTPGTFSSIGGMTNNVAVAFLHDNDTRSMIENAIGGSGQDTINGNAASNTLHGGGNMDTLWGGGGRDFLFGDEGNDTLIGGRGTVIHGRTLGDVLDGGAGKDTAKYSASIGAVDVSLTRGTGIGGDAQGDKLISIENLIGSRWNDKLEGDAGNNEIDGGRGADTMTGGLGDDSYKIDNVNDKIIEKSGEGTDTVVTETLKHVELGANLENLVFLAADAGHYEGIGNSLSNTMSALAFGGTGVDIELRGEAGNDTLNGSGASDVLIGGTGADRMNGGSGSDTLVMDNGNRLRGDIAIGGAGTDTVKADDLTAKAGLNLVLVATGTDIDKVEKHGYQSLAQGVEIVIGNAGGDKLDASALTKELISFQGGAGDDRFIATHSGFDVFDGGSDTDTAVLSGKFADYDVKHDAEKNTDWIVEKATGNIHVMKDVERLAFSDGTLTVSDALASVKLINGTAKGETLNGRSANERIDGGNGADTLHGNAGADQLFGGEGKDKLLGGSGNDTLNGGADKDVLIGGVGNDLLTGGTGDDTFRFAGHWGQDTITDFAHDHDVLELDVNGLTRMSQLTITDTAHGASIAFHGDAILLEGVSASTLHASDFHFV